MFLISYSIACVCVCNKKIIIESVEPKHVALAEGPDCMLKTKPERIETTFQDSCGCSKFQLASTVDLLLMLYYFPTHTDTHRKCFISLQIKLTVAK